MSNIVTINRDPFARTETVREKVEDGVCDWCGQKGRRFRYGTQQDGVRVRVGWHRGNFCGYQCYESYE